MKRCTKYNDQMKKKKNKSDTLKSVKMKRSSETSPFLFFHVVASISIAIKLTR